MNAPQEKVNHALQNAEGWASSIAEMVAALECDYDRLEELRDELQARYDALPDAEQGQNTTFEHYQAALFADGDDDAKELHDLNDTATVDDTMMENAEAARERIQESPLSVEVRDGWRTPGADKGAAEEFCILLSTGGPALRIMGELDEHAQPTRAWLEYQDWGTPWTHHYVKDFADTLLTFCQQFYFGE